MPDIACSKSTQLWVKSHLCMINIKRDEVVLLVLFIIKAVLGRDNLVFCYPRTAFTTITNAVVDGIGLATHVRFPSVRARLAATARFFFATKGATDFRT